MGVSEQSLVSIVIPALNEELTIGEFIDWCHEGIEKAGVTGQVLIVDSSKDNTANIAAQKSAEVLSVPKRGLGQAYIDALPHIKGRYVIMGDADLTYDFREIKPFIDKLDDGYEFVIGSRYKGYIEPGAMPKLHQYFGTPVTTWILNLIYKSHFSDIHCGMRAITLDALLKINLQSQSWEYASEMVLKAVKYRLKSTEVPVRFYKDRAGRLSHHKRLGWISPWIAGWENLKAMFLYAPDFFLERPGEILFLAGLILTSSLANGPYWIGSLNANLHWMLFGLTLTTVGYNALQLAWLSKIYYNFDPIITQRILRIYTYNRGTLFGIISVLCGLILGLALVYNYISNGLRLYQISYHAVFGLLLIIFGFQTFTFTLLLHMILNGRKGN
jgi:glycosyltransferase involved in cell wall biosynthesis